MATSAWPMSTAAKKEQNSTTKTHAIAHPTNGKAAIKRVEALSHAPRPPLASACAPNKRQGDHQARASVTTRMKAFFVFTIVYLLPYFFIFFVIVCCFLVCLSFYCCVAINDRVLVRFFLIVMLQILPLLLLVELDIYLLRCLCV